MRPSARRALKKTGRKTLRRPFFFLHFGQFSEKKRRTFPPPRSHVFNQIKEKISLTVGSDRQRLIFWTLLNEVDIRHQHARATLRGFAFMNILRRSVRLRAAPAATSRFLPDKRFSPFSLGGAFRAPAVVTYPLFPLAAMLLRH